jgi:hypothetical protein
MSRQPAFKREVWFSVRDSLRGVWHLSLLRPSAIGLFRATRFDLAVAGGIWAALVSVIHAVSIMTSGNVGRFVGSGLHTAVLLLAAMTVGYLSGALRDRATASRQAQAIIWIFLLGSLVPWLIHTVLKPIGYDPCAARGWYYAIGIAALAGYLWLMFACVRVLSQRSIAGAACILVVHAVFALVATLLFLIVCQQYALFPEIFEDACTRM